MLRRPCARTWGRSNARRIIATIHDLIITGSLSLAVSALDLDGLSNAVGLETFLWNAFGWFQKQQNHGRTEKRESGTTSDRLERLIGKTKFLNLDFYSFLNTDIQARPNDSTIFVGAHQK